MIGEPWLSKKGRSMVLGFAIGVEALGNLMTSND